MPRFIIGHNVLDTQTWLNDLRGKQCVYLGTYPFMCRLDESVQHQPRRFTIEDCMKYYHLARSDRPAIRNFVIEAIEECIKDAITSID